MNFKKIEPLLNTVQKPARYTGMEMNSVIKNKEDIAVRYAFCFPDLYEIGMSHLGLKILYSLKNKEPDIWCERVFSPDVDMEEQMRKHDIPLYGLESLDPIKDFDMIGFTLQYELTYTTILNMLDLAGLPLRSKDRHSLSPIVMAGGPCACNPEPLAGFFDLFVIGEGEEVNMELIDLYKIAKEQDWSKKEFLTKAAQIQGVYVPELYEISYKEEGTIKEITPTNGAPARVKKRIIEDLDSVYFPESFVVPYLDVVHDRTMLEVLRGCIHGCRFCQAGFIYRPYREKTAKTLNLNALTLTENTGYEEISLTSLSTSDLSELDPLLRKMLQWTPEKQINLSLPSLRIDNVSEDLLQQVAQVRRSGLTFAPEAGTQRLRDVINKNITQEEILQTCLSTFEAGYTSVKLYFMLGLPTETDEDVKGIAELAQRIVNLFYNMENRPKGKTVSVSISAACFVPKPFTPFEFEPQDTMEEFSRKQRLLKDSITSKQITYRYHDSPTSVIEAVLARGDRRLCHVVEDVYRKGARLEGWSEHFDKSLWEQSLLEHGLEPSFYANRTRPYDEISPWSLIDVGVTHEFFVRENKKAREAKTTPNCKARCGHCGAAELYVEGEVRPPCR